MLKRLHSTEKKDFDQEVEICKAFSHHTNPHLVKLLATFCLKNRYYLVFPNTNANLRSYWKKTPIPSFSKTTVLWCLKQYTGIASGLMAIHEYQTTFSEEDGAISPTSNFRLGSGLQSSPLPEHNEQRYWLHGDIKPENIWWTEENVRDENSEYNAQGLLIIADFGLVDFYERQTRSRDLSKHINGSSTYEPPERPLDLSISRAYDIWSLGCVYLEFMTWLISGWMDLHRFPEVRGETGVNEINDDTFYSIRDERPANPRRVTVRESVVEWIKDLHEKPRCSRFGHEFLNLIQETMLVVDATKRINCRLLNVELGRMLKEAEDDPSYLTSPVPYPPRERNATALAIQHKLAQATRDSPPPSP
jgi:serine/threonine protein kinase